MFLSEFRTFVNTILFNVWMQTDWIWSNKHIVTPWNPIETAEFRIHFRIWTAILYTSVLFNFVHFTSRLQFQMNGMTTLFSVRNTMIFFKYKLCVVNPCCFSILTLISGVHSRFSMPFEKIHYKLNFRYAEFWVQSRNRNLKEKFHKNQLNSVDDFIVIGNVVIFFRHSKISL